MSMTPSAAERAAREITTLGSPAALVEGCPVIVQAAIIEVLHDILKHSPEAREALRKTRSRLVVYNGYLPTGWTIRSMDAALEPFEELKKDGLCDAVREKQAEVTKDAKVRKETLEF